MDATYKKRWESHKDELEWLYMEMYGNSSMYAELTECMQEYYKDRNEELKKRDRSREKNPDWYKGNNILGEMLYIDNFANDLKGVLNHLSYLEETGVNYIHLMPFLDTPEGRSDGGYAVSDFRKVRKDLGTMEDLSALTRECHKRGMDVCCDFVMNHTSEEHEWARRARSGDGEYMSRYFFYDNYEIPRRFEETVPQVFPETAPGNFTWVPEAGHYVMTSFYPYQWDLNYANPRVFNEMIYNFLYLANRGIDVVRLDAVPYIWKELGTNCRNLPKVHSLVRQLRLVCEIVCPGVLLLGEVVMEPDKVVPYFGTVEKPECHLLYNVTMMATIWHTVATRNVRLLKEQLWKLYALPKQYQFLNYLRCHDDIGWGLDFDSLMQEGIGEVSHKKYLNDYFLGYAGDSNSRGALYNYDPNTGDARLCGTTASLCGVEKAGFEKNEEAMGRAIELDLMLHAFILMQSGIPILYSGDEIGSTNDYSYQEDPLRNADSRYLHRGKMNWNLAKQKDDPTTVEGSVFCGLKKLTDLRKKEALFCSDANTYMIETHDPSVLCIAREREGERMIGLFNFSEFEKTAWIREQGTYQNMLTGKSGKAVDVVLPGDSFVFLKRRGV